VKKDIIVEMGFMLIIERFTIPKNMNANFVKKSSEHGNGVKNIN
jgi:hypothetical protein